MKTLLPLLLFLLASCGPPQEAPPADPIPEAETPESEITPAGLCLKMIRLDHALKGIIDKELQRMFRTDPPLKEPGIKERLAKVRGHIDGALEELGGIDLGGHEDFEPMRAGVRKLFASYRRQFDDAGWTDFLIARSRPEALLKQPRQARLLDEQMKITLELRMLQLELARTHGFEDRLRQPE